MFTGLRAFATHASLVAGHSGNCAIIEIKGYRGEDAKGKKNRIDVYWVPGVNNLGECGRWAFAECADVPDMEAKFCEVLTADER